MKEHQSSIEVDPHELPGSIFMQPWWLDIVAQDEWSDIRIEKGGDLKARWPIVRKKKKGFVHIEMPVLTQKLGPWIKKVSDKQVAIHSNERSILEELIISLPKFDRFTYNLDESVISYLPFKWNGFNQSSVTSFRIHSPIHFEQIWENLKSSVRRDVRRAEENCELTTELSVEILYDQIKKTYSRKGEKLRFSFEILKQLVIKAKQKNRADIVGVLNMDGEIIAAQLFVHDDTVSYYLAGGFDNEKMEAGAVSLGLLEGIKLAQKRNNSFDFEGSSIKGVERFFSSFGSYPIHFHNIQKISARYLPIHMGKELRKLF